MKNCNRKGLLCHWIQCARSCDRFDLKPKQHHSRSSADGSNIDLYKSTMYDSLGLHLGLYDSFLPFSPSHCSSQRSSPEAPLKQLHRLTGDEGSSRAATWQRVDVCHVIVKGVEESDVHSMLLTSIHALFWF